MIKNKKIFLTSMITMCVAMPAFAEPSHSGSFPSGGLMQADYTYTNAATSTNMDGVYEGTVNANAQYTDVEYTVTAGNYLPADTESLATCTAGNFCPGLQNTVHYHATNDQGLEACPSGYDNSADGASANTQCYRTCAIANNGTTFTNIAHATAVSGNDYYNTTATDTCVPSACENGWHVNSGACVANVITINWSDTDAADITANNAGTATYGSDIRTPVKAQYKKGKTFTGWRFVKPASSCPIDMSGITLGDDLGDEYVAFKAISGNSYFNSESSLYFDSDDNQTYGNSSGLSNGEFIRRGANGAYAKGIAQCSSDDIDPNANVNDWTSDVYYCWCTLTEVSNGVSTCQATQDWSSPGEFSDYEGDCLNNCAEACAGHDY